MSTDQSSSHGCGLTILAASLISPWLLWWPAAESHYNIYDRSAVGYFSHAHCIVLLYSVGNNITTTNIIILSSLGNGTSNFITIVVMLIISYMEMDRPVHLHNCYILLQSHNIFPLVFHRFIRTSLLWLSSPFECQGSEWNRKLYNRINRSDSYHNRNCASKLIAYDWKYFFPQDSLHHII